MHIIHLHILGSSLSVIAFHKLNHPDFLRVLSALPGSNCPDKPVNIFSVIFLYKISSPTFCDTHKNIFTSILKHDVDIYKDLYIDIMLSAGCIVYPNIANSEQKQIMFLTLNTMKIKVINGMGSSTLPKL